MTVDARTLREKNAGLRDAWASALSLSLHPLSRFVNRARVRRAHPFFCVITPVHDGSLSSLSKLVQDLRQQSFGHFVQVMVSNGPSPAIAEFAAGLGSEDSRFVYDEYPGEPTDDVRSLVANLGRRRQYALERYEADRYLFLDADLKLLDRGLLAKLYLAHRLGGRDVIIVRVKLHDLNLPVLPIVLGRIDMANFSFSRAAAERHSYPVDVDTAYGFANDFRFFERLMSDSEALFLDFLAAEKDGNKDYWRVTDRELERQRPAQAPTPVFGNTFREEDLRAVGAVLDSHLAGSQTSDFERAFRREIGFSHGAATNSATNAFWLLFRALGLTADDEVILPNIHFHGVRHALELLGVPAVISDTAADVPVLTPRELEGLVGDRTRAIVFLDFGGWPAPAAAVREYLDGIGRRDIRLVLDAANSPFTKVGGSYIAREYDYAVYSFDMNKILVTGDGGMVLSDDGEVVERVRRLAQLGVRGTGSAYARARQGDGNWWSFEVDEPSLKMTMNNIAAGLGLSQLEIVREILDKRQAIRELYRRRLRALAGAGLVELAPDDDAVENDLYFFWLKTADSPARDALARFLLAKGIYTTVKYQPLDPGADTPNALDFWERSLCLPLHQNVSPWEAEHITSQVSRFFQGGE